MDKPRGEARKFPFRDAVFSEYIDEEVSLMYAIIKTGGKQYRVQEGDSIFVEKLNADVDSNVVFDQVLAVVNDGDVKVGTPVVEGAKVTAKVLAQGKEKKVLVFKYKAKSNYRRRQGHRQPFTKVAIEKIEG